MRRAHVNKQTVCAISAKIPDFNVFDKMSHFFVAHNYSHPHLHCLIMCSCATILDVTLEVSNLGSITSHLNVNCHILRISFIDSSRTARVCPEQEMYDTRIRVTIFL